MTHPVKDRSGSGLAPKAERRAAGKQARERRLRARRRAQLLRTTTQVVAPLLVVAAIVLIIAASCGAFSDDKATPGASPSAGALDPKLQTQPVVSAGSGDLTELKVETLITGTGPKVVSGQSISVNYIGVFYKTGEKFDASWDGGQPATFNIGVGAVIPGWDQGLVGVPVGSRVQLDIPSDLAYGPTAKENGKPEGPLRFVVDVLSAT